MSKSVRSLMERLKKRSRTAHKGDFGRVLIVAGSKGYTGAAHLAALGALRAGAGLITLAVPEAVYSILARREAEVMVKPFASTRAGSFAAAALKPLVTFAAGQDVLALGPGLSRSEGLKSLVWGLVKSWSKPLVLDADALNALCGKVEALKKRIVPAVLTPHTGEFARLFGGPVPVSAAERSRRALAAARLSGAVVLLKGHRTVIASPEGKIFINKTGNPGMATGGTGDVLTGIIAAFLGQGCSPVDAARLGAHIHGLSGDLAAREIGELSLAAGDVADYLPRAFQQMSRRRTIKRKTL